MSVCVGWYILCLYMVIEETEKTKVRLKYGKAANVKEMINETLKYWRYAVLKIDF